MRLAATQTALVLVLCMFVGCAHRGPSAVPPGFKYPELGETVQVERPISAARLAGRVLDQAGYPVNQALVEITNDNWSRRLAARFTDEQGWFEFPGKGKEYSIKVTKPGFAPLLAKIKIEESAPRQVDLTMYVAT